MSSEKATTDFLKLIQAHTTLKVVQGHRSKATPEAQEPTRPYVRVKFTRLGIPTGITGQERGLATIEIWAGDEVSAWAYGTRLTDSLKTNSTGLLKDIDYPSVSRYSLMSPWAIGHDPLDGASLYCSLSFHYFP